jgi:A/G-specific adenine glycosylase
VSEIMLQQTRVETVIPYYERFMSRFPTAEALAAAHEDSVLAHWSGLGYYRRARLLHRGVREVVASYGGSVPEDAAARLALPGVGRYTAGAIGSIAFQKEEPVVDGNVSRVLARLLRIETPLGEAATTKRLWEEARGLVTGERPGDLNQALMELGATLCGPRDPQCDICPLASTCQAHVEGDVARFPVMPARKPPQERKLFAVVATRGRGAGRRVWLVREEKALFGGLWGVPMSEVNPRTALREACVEARLASRAVGRVDHVLTHRRLRIDVFVASGAESRASTSRRLFDGDALERVGVSTLTKKILATAQRP